MSGNAAANKSQGGRGCKGYFRAPPVMPEVAKQEGVEAKQQ